MGSSKGLRWLGAKVGQRRASTCRSSPGAAGLFCTLTEEKAEAAMLPERVGCNPVLEMGFCPRKFQKVSEGHTEFGG